MIKTPSDPEDGARRSIGARRNPASQEAILDAAEALLNEGGMAGFSIEAVARRARAGKPTIYRWWPNRTVLLLDVYRRLKNARPFPDTGSLREDLTSFLENQLLGFWDESLAGGAYRALIAEAQVDDEAAAALRLYQDERKAAARQLVDRARARGEVGPDCDSAIVIDLLVGFAWHYLLIGQTGRGRAGIRAAVDMVLTGAPGYRPAK